ncbi:hypothetical protein L195_g061074, partial [Trifolium pratense]
GNWELQNEDSRAGVAVRQFEKRMLTAEAIWGYMRRHNSWHKQYK